MPSESEDFEFYRRLYQIRRFEETILDEFSKGRFFGTTHTYLGQEANAVGVLAHLEPEDIVVSNHRSHGHFLAYGGDMRALFAELMGRSTGVCGGRGGSQHLHWRNFYSNGILGGTVPLATGMAFAEKKKGGKAIVVAFLGDGALGEGVVYEALNMAALWELPVLFVLENNWIAQTTPLELHLHGDIPTRFQSFGIPPQHLDSSDIYEILETASIAIRQVRSTGCPRALILDTFRFGPHSKGDDTRPKEQLDHLKSERDPVKIQGARLSQAVRQQVEEQVDEQVREAFLQASQDPYPELSYD